jgi:preprotein translocase subunit SecD
MKRLQTILITGSLPVKMDVVKADSISPVLGDDFVKNALIMSILAMLAVAGVILIRYRNLKVAIPMLFTMVSEVTLIMGVASLIQWNIDMAAIAGIIVAVGTGVDDQIIIADETLRGESQKFGWKERFKRAFFIIMVAYFTSVAAMVPLLFAGAGLLKGFALTTILGISIGVFITRPAYAAVIQILLKK